MPGLPRSRPLRPVRATWRRTTLASTPAARAAAPTSTRARSARRSIPAVPSSAWSRFPRGSRPRTPGIAARSSRPHHRRARNDNAPQRTMREKRSTTCSSSKTSLRSWTLITICSPNRSTRHPAAPGHDQQPVTILFFTQTIGAPDTALIARQLLDEVVSLNDPFARREQLRPRQRAGRAVRHRGHSGDRAAAGRRTRACGFWARPPAMSSCRWSRR